MNGIIVLIILILIATAAFFMGAASFGYLFNERKCCLNPDNFKKCFGHEVGSSGVFKKTCCADNATWVMMNALSDRDPKTNGYDKYCK